MEQWVTDTFYSYFPGFNNENQKRQNYLRERQRENQQNFLKHQVSASMLPLKYSNYVRTLVTLSSVKFMAR